MNEMELAQKNIIGERLKKKKKSKKAALAAEKENEN